MTMSYVIRLPSGQFFCLFETILCRKDSRRKWPLGYEREEFQLKVFHVIWLQNVRLVDEYISSSCSTRGLHGRLHITELEIL